MEENNYYWQGHTYKRVGTLFKFNIPNPVALYESSVYSLHYINYEICVYIKEINNVIKLKMYLYSGEFLLRYIKELLIIDSRETRKG